MSRKRVWLGNSIEDFGNVHCCSQGAGWWHFLFKTLNCTRDHRKEGIRFTVHGMESVLRIRELMGGRNVGEKQTLKGFSAWLRSEIGL